MTKRILMVAVAAIVSFTELEARASDQTTVRHNSDMVTLSAGLFSPVSDLQGTLYTEALYGRFYGKGIGFQGGLLYVPASHGYATYAGVPVAFAYRSTSANQAARLRTAIDGAAVTFVDGVLWRDEDMLYRVIASFLANLFNQAEFSAGITPGYVSGYKITGLPESDSVRPAIQSGMSLSLDLGASLNYSINKVDLKIMAGVHYFINNGWYYSIGGGLSCHL